MNTEHDERHPCPITKEKLLTLVSGFAGAGRGREDDENPLPPGPWDPVIRIALERSAGLPVPWKALLLSLLAKRRSEIFDAIAGGPSLGEEVELNPQPLPPRKAFLTALVHAVVARAELLQELAGAIPLAGEQQGIIIVGGRIKQFCDDFCGAGFIVKWPFPGPPPPWWNKQLDAFDQVWMAAQFEQAAEQAFHPGLRRILADASAQFVAAGLSQLR